MAAGREGPEADHAASSLRDSASGRDLSRVQAWTTATICPWSIRPI
jgi:hypothetical protein